ncbi:MAG: RdgB/HAM1 family non-canonical purine NTP pyrophosphatase [Candidatus Eisenbacteria bacterium]|uniref:dITP/XTP pyrophosphatase n=1 Tax=Eiseniibacteriota bacterium TaxID=2212470 RepID=A0A849SGF7_UNCEI|nr:RdgB/HAM1 family non-canonical purine NTP pyrophosphatase [Candidatus Eisenbacteria bacterium]
MSAAVPLEFVLATFNPDKARELETLISGSGLRLRSLAEFPGATAPEELGATLIENARIKAQAACAHTGRPSIADDTGFEVEALDGAPGVHAARFAGPAATYADNVRLLLERLAGVAAARRAARFRTVCLARFPDGREVVAEGVLEGRVIEAPRGSHGFGYDPVFVPTGETRTLAEFSAAEKNAISHRSRAVQALVVELRR